MKKSILLFTLIISILAVCTSGSLDTASAAQTVLCAADIQTMSQQELAENVLRLHIRANSNSDEDQTIKLQVRDEVTSVYGAVFAGMTNLEEATAYVTENKTDMCSLINDYLQQAGFDYTCEIKVERCLFPEKTYDTLTFPAGEYLAVNIILGSGSGDNWWCVLFPPLCFLNAHQDESLPQNEIKFKWKIAELIDSWFKK
jgi:stage II sporulation protein R